MADEIKATIQMQYDNGLAKDNFLPGTVNIDQSSQGKFNNIIAVSTSEGDLTFTGITTEGYVVGRNLDSTNFVTVGPSTGGALYPFLKLQAGEPFAFRLDPSATWRWVANSAPVNVEVMMLEN